MGLIEPLAVQPGLLSPAQGEATYMIPGMGASAKLRNAAALLDSLAADEYVVAVRGDGDGDHLGAALPNTVRSFVRFDLEVTVGRC